MKSASPSWNITGNLGGKLATYLISTKQFDLFLVDVHEKSKIKHDIHIPIVEYIQADLRTQQSTWTRRLRRTDVVIHFACANSQPDATWTDAAASMDITFNVLLQAAKARVGRVIIASSCHVAGGWKDQGGMKLAQDGSNALPGSCEPYVGMMYAAGDKFVDSTAYASPHFAAERLASSLAATFSETSFVAIRIGSCERGENRPGSTSPSGQLSDSDQSRESLCHPGSGSALDDPGVIDDWFRSMWLSDEDFIGLFRKCIECSLEDTKGSCLIMNGVSANGGSRWLPDASKPPVEFQARSDSSTSSSSDDT
ncbi:uncharacterized protein LOC135829821 [Sycon ciliatum]|uniref:uncharacterized protein LOC135829821 n=1 Tax=Sycon ciliatum TaxID=27933 RepID=UPI0031F70509